MYNKCYVVFLFIFMYCCVRQKNAKGKPKQKKDVLIEEK